MPPHGFSPPPAPMPDYHIFGDTFRSDLTFPELLPCDTAPHPRWVLARVTQPASFPDAEFIGKEEVESGVFVSLYRSADVFRLEFDDTGSFDVSADGHRIDWLPPENPDLSAVRKDVLGRVFAACLQQEDIITLHGSAVELGGVAVAFLAPKFHGKSTTASAMVESGARLVADDVVAVSGGLDPVVMPSVPFVQLMRDSAEQVAGSTASVRGGEDAPKLQMAWDAPERNLSVPAPLAAVYLLAPIPPDASGAVRRERLPGIAAALALLGQAKIVGLLGGRYRSVLLQRMADLSERVPVYRLEIPREFARLPELTSALWSWHTSRREGSPVGEPR
jgi:hypothetical protein